MATSPIPARNCAADLSERSAAKRQFSCETHVSHRPFFCEETSGWLALQPAEQAEVILAAYQERLLPELARIERLLTRLAVEFGLEYGGIDELAVFFLDVSREIRHHVRVLEMAVASPASPDGNVSPWQMPANHADIHGLIVRLDSITGGSATGGQTSPCYARLIEGLRKCQQELARLIDIESGTSR